MGEWVLGILDWVLVACIGGLVGAGELLQRYRDAVQRVLMTPPSLFYVTINAVAALAALGIIRSYGLTFGANPGNIPGINVTQVLVAGFGAMAIFRSSVFTTRVGDQDVQVGPSAVLQVLLTATDREVGRYRAQMRLNTVTKIMDGVSYERLATELPGVCLAVLENSDRSGSEISSLMEEVLNIGKLPWDAHTKALSLGILMVKEVGDGVLKAAVSSILSKSPTSKTDLFSEAQQPNRKPTNGDENADGVQ